MADDAHSVEAVAAAAAPNTAMAALKACVWCHFQVPPVAFCDTPNRMPTIGESRNEMGGLRKSENPEKTSHESPQKRPRGRKASNNRNRKKVVTQSVFLCQLPRSHCTRGCASDFQPDQVHHKLSLSNGCGEVLKGLKRCASVNPKQVFVCGPMIPFSCLHLASYE